MDTFVTVFNTLHDIEIPRFMGYLVVFAELSILVECII